MLYEFCISFGSIIVSFALYFGFCKFFQIKRHRKVDDDDTETDNEFIADERHDLDGKELLLVNVVREINFLFVCCVQKTQESTSMMKSYKNLKEIVSVCH